MSAPDIPDDRLTRRLPVRSRRALTVAIGLLGVLIGCYVLAFHNVAVAHADAHAYAAFYTLSLTHHDLRAVARRIADLCQPDPFVFLAAVPIIIALLRRRWALAAALLVMIPGAILTSELLKPLLADPRPAAGVAITPIATQGSWPSGHSTAAMVLAMGFLLASPARWRPYAAVAGSVFALAVIYSVLTLGWHYPSDALGGVLVASIWSLIAMATVWVADARYGRDLSVLNADGAQWLAHMPSVPAVVAVAGLPGAVMLLARGSRAASYATAHTAFVAAVLAIAAVVTLAPAGLTLALSGSDRAATGARPARSRRDSG